jgi:phosphoribosylamine--glycine ligase
VEWEKKTSATVVMSAEGYPGPYREGDPITGLEKAKARPDTFVFEAGVERKMDGGILKPFTKGGRVLAVSALGEDLKTAVANAYAAVGDIDWKGAHYRKDIGGKALNPSLLYESVEF